MKKSHNMLSFQTEVALSQVQPNRYTKEKGEAKYCIARSRGEGPLASARTSALSTEVQVRALHVQDKRALVKM